MDNNDQKPKRSNTNKKEENKKVASKDITKKVDTKLKKDVNAKLNSSVSNLKANTKNIKETKVVKKEIKNKKQNIDKNDHILSMHTIKPALNSKRKIKRIGRGIGSGTGKTSTKGNKGQWARSGGGVRIGFEGGQMPLHRRIPKTGFDNNWKKIYTYINIGQLECFKDGDTVTSEKLLEKKIIKKIQPYGLKILGKGKLTKKLTVKAKKFTKSASKAITKVGGKVEVI